MMQIARNRRCSKRASAWLALAAGLALASPLSAQPAGTVTLQGTVARQTGVPAPIVSCSAIVTGATFVPAVTFAPGATFASTVTTFAFFDKTNEPVGQVDVTPPYAPLRLPRNADNFSCAVKREALTDGTVWPAGPSSSGAGSALLYGGIGGVAIIALLAGHSGSGGTPTTIVPTPSPTPARTSTPTPTPVGATPTPTPVGATPTPTPPGSTPTPSPTPPPTATPTPAPGTPALSSNPLVFNGTGSSNAKTTTLSETGYSGTFNVQSSSCGGGSPIVTFAPSGSGSFANPTTFTVTPQNAGSCSVTYVDSNSKTVTLNVSVTATSIIIQSKRRQ